MTTTIPSLLLKVQDVYRAFKSAGLASSGVHQVEKGAVIDLWTDVLAYLAGAIEGDAQIAVWQAAEAAADLVTPDPEAAALAFVYNDSTEANKGIWGYNTTSSAWEQLSDAVLPPSLRADLQAYVTSAQNAQSAASSSETNAATSENNAAASASSALASATTASESATTATQKAAQVEDAREEVAGNAATASSASGDAVSARNITQALYDRLITTESAILTLQSQGLVDKSYKTKALATDDLDNRTIGDLIGVLTDEDRDDRMTAYEVTPGPALTYLRFLDGIPETLNRPSIINKVYIEDFGSAANPVGQGVAADDTAAFQAAATGGASVRLTKGTTYYLNAGINMSDGFGLINEPDAEIVPVLGASGFNNYSGADGDRNSVSSCLFFGIEAAAAYYFENITLRDPGGLKPILRPVFVKDGKLLIYGLNVIGFPTASGVLNINELRHGSVFYDIFMDGLSRMGDDGDYTNITNYSPAGIVMDDTGATRSQPILLSNFRISNYNRAADSSAPNESDGITLGGIGFAERVAGEHPYGGHVIEKGEIYNVGEGIDCFHDDCVVRDVYFKEIANAPIEMKHGGSKMDASGLVCYNTGYVNSAAVMSVSGSSSANAKPCTNNKARNIKVKWDSDKTPINSLLLVQNSGALTANLARRAYLENVIIEGGDAIPALLKNNTTSAQVTAGGLTADDRSEIINYKNAGTVESAVYDIVPEESIVSFVSNYVNESTFLSETFTPALTTQGTDFTTITYGQQIGVYSVLGDLVVGFLRLEATVTSKGSATDNVVISGFPFNVSSSYADIRLNCSAYISSGDPNNASPSSASNWSRHPNYLRLLGNTKLARLGFLGNLTTDDYDTIDVSSLSDGDTVTVYCSFVYKK